METPTQNMPDGTTEPQNPDAAPAEMMEQKQTFLWPLIGILIAVVALAFGWLYLWQATNTNEESVSENPADQQGNAPLGGASSASAPSSPEDLSDIEADLAADITGIEEDLNAIDAAFEQEP